MTCYIYMHDKEMELPEIKKYLVLNQLNADEDIVDEDSKKLHWTGRKINHVLKKMNNGDALVVYRPDNIACSTSQILEILRIAASRGLSVHFAHYNVSVKNETSQINTQHFIDLISRIESDFVSQRTTQALARRKAAGLPLGRPKGRKNKSLKLDVHKEEIGKYMKIGISKASIAKLVACHPQTLYDWLERKDNRGTVQAQSLL